ncbi:MAG: hypothetical protein ALECFALPRED_004555 [Alectoria fallacina]|uniref:ATP-grasp domain-containing protein n=1 Tax=Alectoria fallacina TaxID=1903189 RepID=A0A8H3FW96_9LECA|nr:MAG: hypothetical protein ALECFALPRED_004555 [Alectoria fallacina]
MSCIVQHLALRSPCSITSSFASSILRPVNKRLLSTSLRSWSNKVSSQDATSATRSPRLAVLFQAIDPPVINGVRKPRKPGGYQDSGADLAFVLQSQTSVDVITPTVHPDPGKDGDWCFPDNEDGILDALRKGATHLWANTILFASHPLQTSSRLNEYQKDIHVIGQPPLLVEKFDDKEYTNNLLRKSALFTMPRGWTVNLGTDPRPFLLEQDLPFPIVGKPIRGRGSQGVKVCYSFDELYDHLRALSQDSSIVMLEEYLSGEEATVTVMPPSEEYPNYWAMPIVTRFNHEGGIAPYNGVVAVTANSRVLTPEEVEKDDRFEKASKECVEVATLLQITAPIRIDIRRFSKDPDSHFALFDINMKPNMTGPGRPGRDDQSSLTALAASALGWNYANLLEHVLETACSLQKLRAVRPKMS